MSAAKEELRRHKNLQTPLFMGGCGLLRRQPNRVTIESDADGPLENGAARTDVQLVVLFLGQLLFRVKAAILHAIFVLYLFELTGAKLQPDADRVVVAVRPPTVQRLQFA